MKRFGLIFSLIFLGLFGCGKETPKSLISMSIISDKMLAEKEVVVEENRSPSGKHKDLYGLYKEIYPNLVSTCNFYNFLSSQVSASDESKAGLYIKKIERSTSGIFTKSTLDQIQENILKYKPQTIKSNEAENQENLSTSYKNSLEFYEQMSTLSPNSGKIKLKITSTTQDKKSTDIKKYDVVINGNKFNCNISNTTETRR